MYCRVCFEEDSIIDAEGDMTTIPNVMTVHEHQRHQYSMGLMANITLA
jgi:hypothetical protein